MVNHLIFPVLPCDFYKLLVALSLSTKYFLDAGGGNPHCYWPVCDDHNEQVIHYSSSMELSCTFISGPN